MAFQTFALPRTAVPTFCINSQACTLSPPAVLARTLASRAANLALATPIPPSALKHDSSPVTALDFAIQGLIASALPTDVSLIAEEDQATFDSLPLTIQTHAATLADLSLPALRAALARTKGATSWICDPIDGTRGLLANLGYAIGLSQTSPGEVSALALPLRNLVLVTDKSTLSLFDLSGRPLPFVRRPSPRTRWHFSPASLEVPLPPLPPPTELCCGSLVKYADVALGASKALVQALPSCRAAAWDHVAGISAVVASGGRVTDFCGAEVRIVGGEVHVDAVSVRGVGIEIR